MVKLGIYNKKEDVKEGKLVNKYNGSKFNIFKTIMFVN